MTANLGQKELDQILSRLGKIDGETGKLAAAISSLDVPKVNGLAKELLNEHAGTSGQQWNIRGAYQRLLRNITAIVETSEDLTTEQRLLYNQLGEDNVKIIQGNLFDVREYIVTHQHKLIEAFEKIQREGTPALEPELPLTDEIIEPISSQIVIRSKLAIDPPPKQTCRTYFHHLANEFGAESALEGSTGKQLQASLMTYLEGVDPSTRKDVYGIDDTLFEQIHGAAFIMGTGCSVEKLQSLIQEAIAQKRPLLMDGGWAGSPSGHCIFYEVIPTPEGTVNMRLFNLGEGSQNNASVIDGIKEKFSPYVEWKGIDENRLTHPLTLKVLIEIANNVKNPTNSKDCQYGSKDIYESLKEILQPNAEESIPVTEELCTSQYSGVCSWKSLQAFLRVKLPLIPYKRLILDIKLNSLMGLVGSVEIAPGDASEIRWRLTKKGFKNLCLRINHAYRDSLISSEYLLHCQGLLRRVDCWIKENKECLIEGKPENQVHKPQPVELPALKLPLLKDVIEGASASSQASSPSHIFHRISSLFLDTPESALEKLIEVNRIAEDAWNNEADDPLHLSLIQFIINLPYEIKFWQKATYLEKRHLPDPEKVELITTQLRLLSQYAFRTSFTVDDALAVHPERIFVQNKLLDLFRCLGQIIDPHASDISISTDFASVHSSYFRSYYAELSKYTNRFNGYRFPFFQYSNDNKETVKIDGTSASFILYEDKDFTILSYLREHHPDLCSQIEKNITDPSDKSKAFNEYLKGILRYNDDGEETPITSEDFTALQDTHKEQLIISSNILPEWLLGLRDTYFSIKWLINMPVATPRKINRGTDLKIKFTPTLYGKKLDYCETSISIKGLDGEIYNDHPVLKAIGQGEYADRFQLLHRKIKDQNLSKLIESQFDQFKALKNKKAFVLKPYYETTSQSLEEFRELAYLFTTGINLSWEILEYYKKHPTKLNDPDYQTLFKLLLFALDLRELGNVNIHSNNRCFRDVLEAFLKEQYEYAELHRQTQTCVFLCQIAGMLGTYRPQSSMYESVYQNLLQLLRRDDLDVKERSVVYGGLLEHLNQQEHLTDEQTILSLKALKHLYEHPISKKWQDPETEKAIREFSYKHSFAIEKFLTHENGIDQAHVNLAFDAEPGKEYVWRRIEHKSGRFHLQTDDSALTYDPLTGEVIGADQTVPIPREIIKHPTFQNLFPCVKHCMEIAHGVIRLFNKYGDEMLISKGSDGMLLIDRKDKEGNWFRYIDRSELVINSGTEIIGIKIYSRYLAERFQHWVSMEDQNKVVVIDPKTGNTCFQWDIDPMLVKNVKTGLTLKFPSNRLSTFEDAAYIHEWYDPSIDDDRLKQLPSVIELPRFGLSFLQSRKDPTQYISKEFPGYRLKANERFPALGVFKEHMVIENAKGKKKVILPIQFPKEIKKNETLLPTYKLERNISAGQNDPQKYMVYDVSSENNLTSTSREGYLHLALVLTLAQKYTGAANVLRKYGEKIGPYSKSELEILSKIISLGEITKDKSGNGIALQTYATYLCFKNRSNDGKDLTEEESVAAAGLYRQYLLHYNRIRACKLFSQEEIFFHRNILKNSIDPIFINRLNEIFKEDVKIYPNNNRSSQEEKKSNSGSVSRRWRRSQDLINSAQKPFLITRASEHYEYHFPYYFQQALEGTQSQKDEILYVSIFLKHHDDEKSQLMGRFFSDVISQPSKYVHYTKKSGWEHRMIWNDVVNAAHQIHVPSPATNFECKVTPLLSKSPPQRRVETKPVAVPFQFYYKPVKTVADKTKLLFSLIKGEKAKSISEAPLAWMESQKEKYEAANALETREYERLIYDLKIHNTKESKPEYEMSQASIRALKNILSKDAAENKKKIQDLKTNIVDLANRHPQDNIEFAKMQIKHWSGHKKITLDEILVSFARKDPTFLQKKNPFLSEEQLTLIYSDVACYLDLSTFEQQRARGIKTINALKKAGSNQEQIHNLIQQLAKTLLTKRCPEAINDPAILVFEYYAEKILWPNQVEKLHLFLNNKEANPVLEMIMGSGKSEILLPLLALLRADGEHLSTIIVPQPLFENVSSSTQRILKDAFSQTLYSLDFNRNTKFTKDSLTTILEDLTHIRENKEALIMTSKSVQCLMMKFVEEALKCYLSGAEKQQFSEKLILLRKILFMIGKQGFPIIDEADTILNVLHEVSFSIGEKLSPRTHEIKLIAKIFELLIDDPEIKAKVRLECDPKPNSEANILTDNVYHKDLKMMLAEKVANLFENAVETDFDLTTDEALILRSLPRYRLLSYLHHSEENRAEAQEFFNAIPNKNVRDILALATEEISHILSHTLMRNCDENYGIDSTKNSITAVPFAAANTPKAGSLFANSYITMNYTFQTYLKKGASLSIIKAEISRLQDQIQSEMRNECIQPHQTQAWKDFCKLKGELDIPLFNIKKFQYQKIVDRINSSNESKLQFVQEFVLPQMQLCAEKLTCTPHNLISFFDCISGFTGTLWNSRSMHRKLTPIPEVGTDAKTLDILWRNSKNEVITLTETDPETLLAQINQVPHDVLIDGGGYFKEMTNREVAVSMAKKSGKPTAFYNELGEKTLTNGTAEVPLKQKKILPEKRQTYLDQSHTTGADVTQKLDAIGLVTVGRNLLLRDLLQNVWRMRGLADSQRVKFLVSKEVDRIIRQELKMTDDEILELTHILAFAIANQAKQQGKDNYKALVEQLWSVPQLLLFDVLMDENLTEEQRVKGFESLKKTWIKPVDQSASELYGVMPIEIESEREVAHQINHCENFIKQCYMDCPFLTTIRSESECLNDLTVIGEKLIHFIPPKVLSPERAGDETVDMENDAENDVDIELEAHNQQEDEYTELGFNYGSTVTYCDNISKTTFDKFTLQAFDLQQVFQLNENLKEYADAFKDIVVSFNVLQSPPRTPTLNNIKMFGSNRTPFHRIEFHQGKAFILFGNETVHSKHTDQYQLFLGFIDRNRTLTDAEFEQIVKIKFLNGECQYTKKERAVLESWIEREGRAKMKTLFERHILLGFPKKTLSYKRSSLCKFLKGQV